MSSTSSSSLDVSPYLWSVDSLKKHITDYKYEKENGGHLSNSLEKSPLTDTESISSLDQESEEAGNDIHLEEKTSSNETYNTLADPIPASSSQEESSESRLYMTEIAFQEKLRKNLERAREQQLKERIRELPLDVSYKEITTESVCQLGIIAGMASAKGDHPLRPTMEDRSLVNRITFIAQEEEFQGHLAGVFDGHGTAIVAEFIRMHLPIFLQTTLEIYNKEGVTDHGIWKALRASFKWLHRLSPDRKTMHGSTAIITFIFQNVIWIANAGDSRAVFFPEEPASEEEKCVTLSEDASLANPRFITMVEKRGGKIIKDRNSILRVNEKLAVASSIGDYHIVGQTGKCCISPIPKITRYPCRKGKLVLASDGLWPRCGSLALFNLLDRIKRETSSEEIMARHIVSSVLKNGSKDNVSVIVIPLSEPNEGNVKRARR